MKEVILFFVITLSSVTQYGNAQDVKPNPKRDSTAISSYRLGLTYNSKFIGYYSPMNVNLNLPVQTKIIINYYPPRIIRYQLRPNRHLPFNALDGSRPKAPYFMQENRYDFFDPKK